MKSKAEALPSRVNGQEISTVSTPNFFHETHLIYLKNYHLMEHEMLNVKTNVSYAHIVSA